MRKFGSFLIGAPIIALLFVSGCELITPPGGPPRQPSKTKDLLLNEVFTISPDKYFAYSWIEMFNGSDHVIPWFDESFPITSYALGTSGAFIRTDDLDRSQFERISLGVSGTYHALEFYYPDTAFIAGDGGLMQKLRRDPSGAFSVQTLNTGTTRNINGVAFGYISAIGFFVGDGGLIKRSVNRGNDWSTLTSNTTKNLHAITFIEFPTKIYTVGDSATILRKSTGLQWSTQVAPATKQTTNLFGVFFATDTGFAVGDSGTILFTKNGGTLWTAQQSTVTTPLRGGFVSDDPTFHRLGRAWAAGDGGVIVRTDDYGQHWKQQVSGTTARLNQITFADSIRGMALGDGGTVLVTANGGKSWTVQNSRTTDNLIGGRLLPLTIRVRNRYVLEMYAKRKTFFVDFRVEPSASNPNFNYYTKIDTGLVVYDPQVWVDINTLFPQLSLYLGKNAVPKSVSPNAFVVLNNDSTRFQDHVKLGPGTTTRINASIVFADSGLVLWDLLASGEIRLVKYFVRQTTGGQPIILGYDRKVIEVVRWGDYYPTTATYPANELYPDNIPLKLVPEGFSVARYANDNGGLLPSEQSTKASFYIAKDPIPGWFSQESKP